MKLPASSHARKAFIWFALSLGLTASPVARAWFFFMLPLGQIQSAIEGDHCVPESAKPGDRINAQGRLWEVKSTHGVSNRCANTPQWPVIAKMEPILSETELKAEMQICAAQGTTVGSRTTVPNVGEVEVVSLNANGCSDTRSPIAARVVRVKGLELMRSGASTVRAGASSSSAPTTPTGESGARTTCVAEGAGPLEVFELPGYGRVEIVRIVGRSPRCFSPGRPMLAEFKHFGTPDDSSRDSATLPSETSRTPAPSSSKSVADRLRELKQLHDEQLITDPVYESRQKEILSGR